MIQTTSDIIQKIRENIDILKQNYSVLKIGVFGSYSRNEQQSNSDIDILVEFDHSNPIGIKKYIGCEEFLEDLLEINVDLVTVPALKPLIKQNVLQDVVYV